MTPGLNIIDAKANEAIYKRNQRNQRQQSWGCERRVHVWSPLRKFLGSKEHLDLIKIDLQI